MSGATKWSGRVLSLIDPDYAKVHMPLVASVSEHQPTMWVNYFSDFSVLLFFVPLGFYYNLVHKMTHGKLFIAMWGVFCVYFSCAMVRLMLVLAPAVCVLAAIAVSHVVTKSSKSIRL
jgi:dolichyl-diphosphooligosaccharide---protein glycosyltransferase